MCRIEKGIRKRVKGAIDVVFSPLLTILASLILYVMIIMPILGFVSTVLCKAVGAVSMSGSPIVRMIAGYISAALFLPMVAMGMHHGLIALYSVQLETIGYVTLYPALAMAGAGQVGAALALAVRARKKGDRKLLRVINGALPAGILGVGEPLIYGVTMPLGKPFITAGIGAGFGGAFVMLMRVASTTWGPSGLLGAFVMTEGPHGAVASVCFYLVGLLISCVAGYVLTYISMKKT
jgi:PTS system sucrose-specific IIC component